MKELFILKEPLGTIKGATDIFRKIKKIDIDFNQENVLVFYLDSKNKVINTEILFKGGLNSCIIDPRTLFRKALKYNSQALLMAHNHPSGNLEPSKCDIENTNKIKDSGKIIHIKLLDHIIFNKTSYYSFIGEV